MTTKTEALSALNAWLSADDEGFALVADGGTAHGSRSAATTTATAAPVVSATPALPDETDYPAEVKAGVYAVPHSTHQYHSRDLGGQVDVTFIRESRRVGSPVLLYGPPGTGKTKMLEAAFGERMITVLGTADTETADFVGTWTQAPDGSFVWVDGPLVRAAEEGRPLFIDEIGLVDPKVLSVVYGAMDGRGEVYVNENPTRGVVRAQPGFYVVAATNPNAPGVRLSEALLSRFDVHVEVTTDYPLAAALGVPKEFITIAGNLDTKRKNGEVSWSPQMRELLAAAALSARVGTPFALANLVSIAPEDAREIVSEVVSKTTGAKTVSLSLGKRAK